VITKSLLTSKVSVLWNVSWLLLMTTRPAAAQAQPKIEEFFDTEYGYFFRYPAELKIQQLPEGKANQDIRVILRGPNASSFTVVVERMGQITQKRFASIPEHNERVEAMMSQTLEQIYKSISQNIKAKDMVVGERRDLSNEVGIKYYLATLHQMQAGKPIVVAGIHAFPFGKDYSINFVMTAFWNPAAAQEQEILTAIFNSFRLVGESQIAKPPEKPSSPAAK
jgi:hypothetical protein